MKIKFINKDTIDYFFIILLVFLSGNRVFGETSLILGFLGAFVLFFYRRKKFDNKFVILVAILIVILLLQTFIFDYHPWVTIIGLLIRIFFVYFVLVSVGDLFVNKLITVMYYISIVSLVVFFSIVIIPGFDYFLVNNFTLIEGAKTDYSMGRYFLGFYTVAISPISGTLLRNSGPFWEAGALGGYVTLSLMLNIISTGKLFNKVGIVFIVVIITTFSTTSMIALFILLVAYGIIVKKNSVVRWVFIPILIISGFFTYTSVDFLNEKITDRMALLDNQNNLLYGPSSRFLDAQRDLDDFRGHEILGRGGHSQTRFLQKYLDNERTSRTHGVTDHLVRYGTIFFILTIFYLYYSQVAIISYFNYVDKSFALVTTFVFLILLQSELYFNLPLFWGLLFLHIYKRGENVIYRNTSI